MMKIGLDFDGVIADSGALKVETAQKMFGVTVDEADFKKEILLTKGILSAEQYKEVQKFVYGDPKSGLEIKEVPHAFKNIQNLQQEHKVLIVTSRSGIFGTVARQWLKKHSVTLEVTEIEYGQSKKEGASGCDVFVDDDLHKLEELVGHIPYLFLFSWPYNVDEKLPSEIIRVENWEDLMQKIKNLS